MIEFMRNARDRMIHKFTPVRDDILIYVHLPKCGGTSLSSILRSYFNSCGVIECPEITRRSCITSMPLVPADFYDLQMGKLRRKIERNAESVECILGHVPYGIHRFLGRRCHYLTVLRDPVSRVWSQLNHIANNQEHYLYQALESHGFDFAKIVGDERLFEFRNDMTRMVLGSKDVEMDERHLNDAIELLHSNYSYVGCIEHESPQEIAVRVLGKNARSMVFRGRRHDRLNRGIYRRFPPFPPEDVSKEISRVNYIDMRLYEHVSSKR